METFVDVALSEEVVLVATFVDEVLFVVDTGARVLAEIVLAVAEEAAARTVEDGEGEPVLQRPLPLERRPTCMCRL